MHILQSTMEMQRSVGELTAKVDRLVTDVGKQGEKIDGLRMKLALFAGGGAVLGWLLGAMLAGLKLIPWDKLIH